jgi:hypothetical protein
LIEPTAPRPKEPAKRPPHHLAKAIHHHRAHRKRIREQLEIKPNG